MQRNFVQYHKSISNELEALKDRVRNIIGESHWLTDGEYKEAILRRMLRAHVPESVHVGRGFVCFPDEEFEPEPERETSNQLDVLITDRNKPTLFKDGDLVIVTPDAVKVVIEVKTRLSGCEIRDALTKLADNIALIRRFGSEKALCGLFCYDNDNNSQQDDQQVLEFLQEASQAHVTRVIDWVALGPHKFFHFWKNARRDVSGDMDGPAWHSYQINDLAHAYFISNVVWEVSSNIPRSMQKAWYPMEHGKESQRKWYCGLHSTQPTAFEH